MITTVGRAGERSLTESSSGDEVSKRSSAQQTVCTGHPGDGHGLVPGDQSTIRHAIRAVRDGVSSEDDLRVGARRPDPEDESTVRHAITCLTVLSSGRNASGGWRATATCVTPVPPDPLAAQVSELLTRWPAAHSAGTASPSMRPTALYASAGSGGSFPVAS